MKTRVPLIAALSLSILVACSGSSGGPGSTPVSFPDGFPVTGMSEPANTLWFEVSPMVTGSMYFAAVVGGDGPTTQLSVEAVKDPSDFGQANTLCYGFADSGSTVASCSFTAHADTVYVGVVHGVPVGETADPVSYTLTVD